MKSKIQGLYAKVKKRLLAEGVSGVVKVVIRSFAKRYLRVLAMSKSAVVMEVLDVMVTEKCTLRCRYCCNLMQYYADPQHYGISELSRGFEALLNNTGMICNINIIGGEPFLYKYLPELFETIDRFRHKYLRLNIITNGTVVPPDGVVCAMKKYNVVCMISDYGIHSRNIQKVVDKMKAFDVPVLVNKDDWQYMAQISGRVDYGEQAQQKYDECNIPCRTIRNGRFYKCEFLANGDNLSVFPHDEKNYVDLNAHVSKAVLAEYLHRSEYYPGCAFCSGSNGKEALIPAAEQVSSRLELFGIASTERDETIETTE